MSSYIPGLEGVVAARTRLSHVDGRAGTLHVAGYPVEVLAAHASFEQAVHLLWRGTLGEPAFARELAAHREVPEIALAVLRAAGKADPMSALRAAAATLDLVPGGELSLRIVASLPTLVAARSRLARGLEPVAPRADLDHAANLLWMLHGRVPRPEEARALDAYLVTVLDHGLNASTFAARVVRSTGSDLLSAVVAAIGALKGPLHGGAPGPALELVREIGAVDRIEPVLRAHLARGERLMGFGHRVYKVRDPRAEVLSQAASALFAAHDPEGLYALTRAVEEVAVRLLDEHKPGRRLRANVELYTALLLHGIGVDTPDFTPIFACGRAAGWVAHAAEQATEGRLLRPSAEYVGPLHEAWSA